MVHYRLRLNGVKKNVQKLKLPVYKHIKNPAIFAGLVK